LAAADCAAQTSGAVKPQSRPSSFITWRFSQKKSRFYPMKIEKMEILPHENWKWRFYSMKIEKMEILPHKN
jgi:hypothetical protein